MDSTRKRAVSKGSSSSSSSTSTSTSISSFLPRSPITSLSMVFLAPLLFLIVVGLLLAVGSQFPEISRFFPLPFTSLSSHHPTSSPSHAPVRPPGNESQDAPAVLEQLENVWREDLFKGLQHARMLLETKGKRKGEKLEGRTRLLVLERAAEMHAHMKDFEGAVSLRREIVSLLSTSQDKSILQLKRQDMALALTSLANDLYLASRFDEALDVLERTLDRFVDILPKPGLSVLHRLESTIFECKGDLVLALQRFEQSLQLAPPRQLEDLRVHLDLLKRTRTFTKNIPEGVAKAMDARIAALTQRLLTEGPWERAEQLPGNYLPGLTARPWHSLEEQPQSVRDAADALRRALPALRAEYLRLRDQGILLPEQECIHDISGGHWRRFEITGYWRPRDEHGCSSEAPAACAIFRELQTLQLGPIRAGYSAIGPHAHLKPHFGMTNGQLKFHLGLIVPRAKQSGELCSRFRVANETRAWEEGQILFFDDSFEHEVWNDCDEERVVFQVVFVHPDLITSGKVHVDDVLTLSRQDAPQH